MKSRLLVLLALVLAVRIAGAADDSLRRAQAPGRVSSMPGAAGPARIDFLFGDSRVSLGSDGAWTVSREVSHHGLLCATYELGVRFGAGESGCNSVEWLGSVRYVTAQQQCNNARVPHSGGDQQPELAREFPRITCAEQVIRCSGNCK
jgi:hypothetical protein